MSKCEITADNRALIRKTRTMSARLPCLVAIILGTTLLKLQGQVQNLIEALNKVDAKTPRELRFELGTPLPQGGHLQGIQWWQDSLLLSGSSTDHAYMLTIPLTNHATLPAKHTNLLPSPFRHAGGFQVMSGRYVAVGLEDNHTKDRSKIWILDWQTSKTNPIIKIDRKGTIKRTTAGAVAMGVVGSKTLLLVGTWDNATIDFYWSNSPTLDEKTNFTLQETWTITDAVRSNWNDPSYGSYQNMNLITDEEGHHYLATFCLDNATNRLDLFELQLDKQTPTAKRFVKRASKVFRCDKTTFKAGAGLRVLKDGSLKVYACSHRDSIIEVFEN